MFKGNKYLVITIVLLGIIIILSVNLLVSMGNRNHYSAVYLDNGEIYFGKLRYFPSLHLTNVYFLQKNYNALTASLSPYMLAKLTNSIWGAEDKLSLNRDKIVWINQLGNNSELARAMENPAAYAIPTTSTTLEAQ